MSLADFGNVLYFGVFASFFGGWVPVRARNLKLVVFHLYVFLSLLILPLLIVLTNGSHPVGWVVYAIVTGAWFMFLKVLNYRIHNALGTDPIPEPVAEGEKGSPSVEGKGEDHSPETGHIHSPETCHTHSPETGHAHSPETGHAHSPETGHAHSSETSHTHPPETGHTHSLEDDEDKDSYEHSGSTLNEGAGSKSNTPTNTPSMELSSMSNDVIKPTAEVNDVASVHSTSIETSIDFEQNIDMNRPSSASGTRDRVCERMSRNDSVHGRLLLTSDDSLEQVRQKLLVDNCPGLALVVDKLPTGLHKGILSGSVLSENIATLEGRVNQLKKGHIATNDGDETNCAIHWLEDEGVWDFYMFDNLEENTWNEASDDLWLRQALENSYIGRPPSPTLIASSGDNNQATPIDNNIVTPTSPDNEALPRLLLIPHLKFTSIELKFARTQLEEYMDRNVTVPEVFATVTLSVLVCVVGSLLLTLSDFFTDFWLFWLSLVIATCHFSLIKSVQSDPSSPGPGQNRLNAVSRAVYFVFVGTLGLIINVAITTSDFTPFCIFGFDVNNERVLVFIRNGLFIFLLFFPILFTLGWMPQFDTFFVILLEQIDMHIFGGTASTGLWCGVYAVGRSLLSCLLLVPFGYLGMIFLEKDVGVASVECVVAFNSFHDDSTGQCTPGGRIAVSFLLGGVVSVSYVLSRSTSNHQYLLDVLQFAWVKVRGSKVAYTEDPLDRIYRVTMLNRLKVDVFVAICVFVLVTVINITSVFCQTEILYYVIVGVTVVTGIVNHYLLPHSRKENPYLCFTEPCIKSEEYSMFEVTVAPKVSIAERLLQVTQFVEKNLLYPIVFLIGFNLSVEYYNTKYGDLGGAILISVVGVKVFRTAFSDPARQHVVLLLTFLFFNFDYRHLSEGLPLDYFIAAILVNKIYDLYLKTYFMFIYIIPSSWSHPFHIVIQPLLIPHCPLIFFQAVVGALVSAPMNPVIASCMFFLSYARPVKFWEKNYNTKRQDTTNTRLEQTLEGNMRNPNPDQLDSLFYEQLTWSLQRDLSGDITLGRWGRVTSGDIFILTNDQLNALVHIIEIGNGFVTFQLRGLEFRGTYCHQREREAITEPLAGDDESCHLPFVLSCKKACVARWMAWEVVSSSYTLHGYSITENQANLVFNAYVYKRAFISYYVRCIIYNLIKSSRLLAILDNEGLQESLVFLASDDAVDLDPLFSSMYNIDWQENANGISRQSFVTAYYDLIRLCCVKAKLPNTVDTSQGSFLVTLCFAFSLLGRRMFFTHANTGSGSRGDNFMHGLYRMFIGDARPNAERDEWIIQDIDSIQDNIIPAARIALKVHQDFFTLSEEHQSPVGLYEAMLDAETNHVITHENDRSWRDSVVLNKPSLLALRYQRSEDTYVNPYKIIRLNSKFVKFRLIKLNRECVRGLWSSQQHELIFLRNSDSERGSIQNHKASLRNMINSSMDLPIGYPIYVSPLQTSFVDLHMSYNNTIVGQIINPLEYTRAIDSMWRLCHTHPQVASDPTLPLPSSPPSPDAERVDDYIDPLGDSDSTGSDEDFWKPIWVGKTVTINRTSEVFESFNEGWLQWPDKSLLRKATVSHWKHWRPMEGVTTGEVVHEWRPFHIQSTSRSHIDKVIVLIKVPNSDNYVLVKEPGIEEVS